MIRNELAKKYKRISLFSAAAAFSILSYIYRTSGTNDSLFIFNKQFSKHLAGNELLVDNILLVIFGSSLFFLIFKLFLMLYSKVIWRYTCLSGFLGGKWLLFYDVYNNNYKEEELCDQCTKVRKNSRDEKDGDSKSQDKFARTNLVGEADIIHNLEGVTINARSFDSGLETASSDAKSLWTTSSSTLFYEIFHGSMTLSNQKGNSLGHMSLHILPNETEKSNPVTGLLRKYGFIAPLKPNVITGHYSFVQGSKLTQGRLTLIKKGSGLFNEQPDSVLEEKIRNFRLNVVKDWAKDFERSEHRP